MHIFKASHSVSSSSLNKHFLPMVPLKIIDKILVEKFEEQPLFFKEECRIFEIWCDLFCKMFGIRVYVCFLFFSYFLFFFRFDGIVQICTKLFLSIYFLPNVLYMFYVFVLLVNSVQNCGIWW